jgi:hypothetical protein
VAESWPSSAAGSMLKDTPVAETVETTRAARAAGILAGAAGVRQPAECPLSASGHSGRQ